MGLPKPVRQRASTKFIPVSFQCHVNQLVTVHLRPGARGRRLVRSIPSSWRHQTAHGKKSLGNRLEGRSRHQVMQNWLDVRLFFLTPEFDGTAIRWTWDDITCIIAQLDLKWFKAWSRSRLAWLSEFAQSNWQKRNVLQCCATADCWIDVLCSRSFLVLKFIVHRGAKMHPFIFAITLSDALYFDKFWHTNTEVNSQQNCNKIGHLSWRLFSPYLVKRNISQFVHI